MRTFSIIFSLAIVLTACKSNNSDKPDTADAEEQAPAYEIVEYSPEGRNQIVVDTVDDGVMLLGHIDGITIQKAPFTEWYTENYEGHAVDSNLVDSIKPLLAGTQIQVYMGSWCEDSQREIPALFKILELVEDSMITMDLIALDHDKQTPDSLQVAHGIEYVPTIIFQRDGVEMNRIVEYPQQSLEQDILTILQGKPYKHTYAD